MHNYFYILLSGIFFTQLIGMENQDCQLDLCSQRKTCYQAFIHNQDKQKKCPFCDPEILKTNYIIREDEKADVREMMNKNPYIPFDQGIHLLIMPLSHKESPTDFSQKDLIEQNDAMQNLHKSLHDNAYTQEYFTSWGKLAGQSVSHWHSHVKNYFKPPCSLPEMISHCEKSSTRKLEEVFLETKEQLSQYSHRDIPPLADIVTDKCLCCKINKELDSAENLIISQFQHNYICLAHHPCYPGEIVIIPKKHVPSITYLLQEELRENFILAMALLPKIREYVQTNIDAACDGGNIYIKSMGGKESTKKQRKYHVYTHIIPRTSAFFFPGSMDGNSCKLEFNPTDLIVYLKEKINEIKILLG